MLIKVGRGTWGLEEWYPGSSKKDAPEGGSEQTSEAEHGGIPFMITQRQKAKLRQLGRTEEEIRDMTPEEAHRVLAGLD